MRSMVDLAEAALTSAAEQLASIEYYLAEVLALRDLYVCVLKATDVRYANLQVFIRRLKAIFACERADAELARLVAALAGGANTDRKS